MGFASYLPLLLLRSWLLHFLYFNFILKVSLTTSKGFKLLDIINTYPSPLFNIFIFHIQTFVWYFLELPVLSWLDVRPGIVVVISLVIIRQVLMKMRDILISFGLACGCVDSIVYLIGNPIINFVQHDTWLWGVQTLVHILLTDILFTEKVDHLLWNMVI